MDKYVLRERANKKIIKVFLNEVHLANNGSEMV